MPQSLDFGRERRRAAALAAAVCRCPPKITAAAAQLPSRGDHLAHTHASTIGPPRICACFQPQHCVSPAAARRGAGERRSPSDQREHPQRHINLLRVH